eukprot:5538716-Amphidinium_carterae.1
MIESDRDELVLGAGRQSCSSFSLWREDFDGALVMVRAPFPLSSNSIEADEAKKKAEEELKKKKEAEALAGSGPNSENSGRMLRTKRFGSIATFTLTESRHSIHEHGQVGMHRPAMLRWRMLKARQLQRRKRKTSPRSSSSSSSS